MLEELKFLGLTDNEIKIYLFLLRNPASSGTQIRRETGVANSRVYASLDNLIKLGIVSFEINQKGKIYLAEDPRVIKDIFKKHVEKVEKVIPELRKMIGDNKSLTTSSMYKGFNGFKNAFYRSVEQSKKKETVLIIGFSNQAYKNEKLRYLLSDVNKKAAKKYNRFKMILDNKDNPFYKDRKFEGISEIRFMNKGFVSPAAINIFSDKVYFFLWDEEPYAFMIQNKNLALGFRNYFNFLWSISSRN